MGLFSWLFGSKKKKSTAPKNDLPKKSGQIQPQKRSGSQGTRKSENIIVLDENILEELRYKWESADEIIDALLAQSLPKSHENLKFIEHLVNLVDQEKFELPVLPDVAMRIIALSYNKNAEFIDYVNLIKTDQVLALKLLEIANSPLYRGLRQIHDLNLAISRIGINGLKDMVMTLSMKTKVFNHKHYKEKVESVWQTSLLTAMLAAGMANLFNVDPSKAYTMGLVHDIGQIVVYNSINSFRKFYQIKEWPDPFFVHRVSMSFHQQLSAFTLNKWNFDDEIIDLARHHHNVPKSDESNFAKLLYFSYQTSVIINYIDLNEATERVPGILLEQSRKVNIPDDQASEIYLQVIQDFATLKALL